MKISQYLSEEYFHFHPWSYMEYFSKTYNSLAEGKKIDNFDQYFRIIVRGAWEDGDISKKEIYEEFKKQLLDQIKERYEMFRTPHAQRDKFVAQWFEELDKAWEKYPFVKIQKHREGLTLLKGKIKKAFDNYVGYAEAHIRKGTTLHARTAKTFIELAQQAWGKDWKAKVRDFLEKYFLYGETKENIDRAMKLLDDYERGSAVKSVIYGGKAKGILTPAIEKLIDMFDEILAELEEFVRQQVRAKYNRSRKEFKDSKQYPDIWKYLVAKYKYTKEKNPKLWVYPPSVPKERIESYYVRQQPEVQEDKVFKVYEQAGDAFEDDTKWKKFLKAKEDEIIALNKMKLRRAIIDYTQDLNVTDAKKISADVSNQGFEGKFLLNTDKGDKIMTTRSIWAGGYNIQKLHYRYIIHMSDKKS